MTNMCLYLLWFDEDMIWLLYSFEAVRDGLYFDFSFRLSIKNNLNDAFSEKKEKNPNKLTKGITPN